MNTLIDMLEENEVKTKKVLGDACDTLDEILAGIHRDFSDNVIHDLPYNFGEHLYTILGDNINSTRQVTLAKGMFEDGGALASFQPSDGDIEQFLKNKVNSYGLRHVYTHISTGRKFGMSYYNSSKGRMYTTYLDKSNVFAYLQQEHVDLIKDDYKRNAAQKFLDLRNAIRDELERRQESVVSVDITATGAVLSTVNKTPVLSNQSMRSMCLNGNKSKHYSIIENYVDEKVANVLIASPTFYVWNGKSKVMSRELRSDNKGRNEEYVSLAAFGSVNKNDAVAFYGNVDMCYEKPVRSIKNEYKDVFYGASQLGHFSNKDLVGGYNGLFTKCPELAGKNILMPKSILLEWDKVLNDPAVKAEFDSRLGMFKDFSKQLHDLKTEFADLYFLFAD